MDGSALLEGTRPAIFLDRDGVLTELIASPNGQTRPPWNVSELHILLEAQDKVSQLADAKFEIFVVTNQPDVGRGLVPRESVDEINQMLCVHIPDINQVRTCFHTTGDNCHCRKPKPGMLRELATEFQLDLERSWLIGDRWIDIAAGASAGCLTILIEHPYSWSETSVGPPPDGLRPTCVVESLSDAVDFVLRSKR